MPLDTQTFALSRWWASTALDELKRNSELFSKSNLRLARRRLLAGKNQLMAIRSWLICARLIEKDGRAYRVTRMGESILENDNELRKSSTWWAFHLLVCLGEDSFPYDALFRCLDTNVHHFISSSVLRSMLMEMGNSAESSVSTYFEGVSKMFRRDGTLQGLGLVEVKKGTLESRDQSEEIFWRAGTPTVPDAAILFALALAKDKFFVGRPSIDFGELIEKRLDRYLTLSQDDLRRRLNSLSNSSEWREEIVFNDVANLASISFGKRFTSERMLLALLQGGEDSWI